MFKPMRACLFFLLSATLLPAQAHWTQDPEVKHFVRDCARRHHLPAQHVEHVLAQAKLNPKVIQLMRHPYESKPWYHYRTFFVQPARIHQGAIIWNKHALALHRVTRKTGVPEEVMLAIVGMESNYGRNIGQFRALDTLATLGFAYPPRALYFRYELGQLIKLADEQHFDITALKSSYAGALGMPQFMPSSYRHFATDIDGDGVVDLFKSHPDSFASIGHFLQHYGWKRHHPIAEPATLKPHQVPSPIKRGEMFNPKAHPAPRAWFIMMDERDHPAYWKVHSNFRALLHYNNSPTYALAVSELAQAIRAEHLHVHA